MRYSGLLNSVCGLNAILLSKESPRRNSICSSFLYFFSEHPFLSLLCHLYLRRLFLHGHVLGYLNETPNPGAFAACRVEASAGVCSTSVFVFTGPDRHCLDRNRYSSDI